MEQHILTNWRPIAASASMMRAWRHPISSKQTKPGQHQFRRIVSSFLGGKRLVLLDPQSQFVRAFRELALNVLAHAAQEPELKVLLIASAFSGDGRSTMAANLAVALAAEGSDVILVDADTRRMQARLFGLDSQPLTAAELRGADIPIIHLDIPNLRFVLDSPITADYNGARPRLEQTRRSVRALRDAASFVIIDAPACADSADALSLATTADAMIYVVRRGKQDIPEQERIREQLRQLGTRLLGVVFNER